MVTFEVSGSTVSKLQSHYKEIVYFLPLNPQKFPVLIWSNLEGWKAKSTLEPPRSFEHETPALGIQRYNH